MSTEFNFTKIYKFALQESSTEVTVKGSILSAVFLFFLHMYHLKQLLKFCYKVLIYRLVSFLSFTEGSAIQPTSSYLFSNSVFIILSVPRCHKTPCWIKNNNKLEVDRWKNCDSYILLIHISLYILKYKITMMTYFSSCFL